MSCHMSLCIDLLLIIFKILFDTFNSLITTKIIESKREATDSTITRSFHINILPIKIKLCKNENTAFKRKLITTLKSISYVDDFLDVKNLKTAIKINPGTKYSRSKGS